LNHTIDIGIRSGTIPWQAKAAHLRAIQQKYSAVAYDAMLVPICKEIDRQKPVPPRRRTATEHSPDPLTAPIGFVS
jgi:hypothetical protein